MPLWLFSLLTVVDSGVWNTVFVGLGHQLGGRWTEVGSYSDLINYVVIGGIVLAIAVFYVRRLRHRRREGSQTRSATSG